MPNPKARAVVKRASFSLIELSFQVESWGNPKSRGLIVIVVPFGACGLWGNVWAGGGFLPRPINLF
jgi:hypothetical protein